MRGQTAYRIPRAHCLRCGHQWVPQVPRPRVCAKCHSPWYDLPPRVKPSPPSDWAGREKVVEAGREVGAAMPPAD